MKKVLEKMIETTNQLVKPFNIHKTRCVVSYFYLGQGKSFNIKFFNEKEEEIICDVDYNSSSFIIDFTNFLNDVTLSEKVNSGALTIYSSGKYESSFIWDEQADLENLMLAVWQTIDYWGNKILLDYLYSAYPDWQKAVIKSYIKGDKVVFQLISLNEQSILTDIDISEDIQADYIAWQDYCINGKLKSLFATPWNGIIFNLDISQYFSGKKDTEFIFDGNA